MKKKKEDKIKSECCNAKVKIGGIGATHYYICMKCNKPCNIII